MFLVVNFFSYTQQHDQFQKVEEVSADDKNTLPEREVPTEKAESFNQTIQIAQRNMVWVKVLAAK